MIRWLKMRLGAVLLLLNVPIWPIMSYSGANGTEAGTEKVVETHLFPSWWTKNGRWRRISTITSWDSSRSQWAPIIFVNYSLDIPGWIDSHRSWFQSRRGRRGKWTPENGTFLSTPRTVADRISPVSLLFHRWNNHPPQKKIQIEIVLKKIQDRRSNGNPVYSSVGGHK